MSYTADSAQDEQADGRSSKGGAPPDRRVQARDEAVDSMVAGQLEQTDAELDEIVALNQMRGSIHASREGDYEPAPELLDAMEGGRR